MKDRQFHIYLDDEEYGQVLQALILSGGKGRSEAVKNQGYSA